MLKTNLMHVYVIQYKHIMCLDEIVFICLFYLKNRSDKTKLYIEERV